AGLDQLLNQLIGTVAVGVFTFAFAFGLMYALKVTVGVRVSEEHEAEGLDYSEHGMQSYTGFVGS
ncbi:MAG: ammonium transporter, partial [Chitinophagales bacterium]